MQRHKETNIHRDIARINSIGKGQKETQSEKERDREPETDKVIK
jgi:hypothetical protein